MLFLVTTMRLFRYKYWIILIARLAYNTFLQNQVFRNPLKLSFSVKS